MEVDADAYRTGLHTLFNTDKLSSLNFSGSMSLLASKFSGTVILPVDNTDMDFGSGPDSSFGMDSSKRLFWDTVLSTTEIRFYAGSTYYIEFAATGLNVPTDIVIGEGGSSCTVLQALSSYKKPVLEYSSSTAITLQNNTATTDNSVVYFPSFVASVTEATPTKYRKATLTNTANGYGTGDSGAAQGGMRSGVTLTANNWYYVYAAKLRSGSDFSATTAKFVMVVDSTSPDSTNHSTLDTRYGSGNWVYLGTIRYGFGAAGSTTGIIKFKHSNKGHCSFYEKSSSGYGGLNLAYTTTDADNTGSPFYTIAAGTSGNVIPAIFTTLTFNLARERVSKWYVKDASGDVVWDGGWQDDDGTLPHGFLVELVNDTNYGIFQLRKSNNAGTAKAVVLAGYVDPYIHVRRHGHGL